MKLSVKKAIIAITVLACVSMLFAAPAPKAPVLHLPLNEGKGSQVTDVVSQTDLSVIHPEFSGWGEGANGAVLELRNKHQAMNRACINVPWPKFDLARPFTIMMAIKTAPDLMRKRSYQLAVIGGRDEGCFALELAWDMLFYVAYTQNGEKASIVTKPAELKISANTWYKLVWVYDGKVIRTYVDGMERASGEARFTTPAKPYILLGASSAGGAGYGFEGLIADFRVYDHAFTSSEVAQAALEE